MLTLKSTSKGLFPANVRNPACRHKKGLRGRNRASQRPRFRPVQNESTTTPTRSRPRSRRRGSAAVRMGSLLASGSHKRDKHVLPIIGHVGPNLRPTVPLHVWLRFSCNLLLRFSCYWLTVRPNFGLQSADLLLGVPLKTGLGSSARTSGNNPQQTSPLFS